ncbi:MAG: hypothetical protein LBS06_03100 [Treponema sp.]|nr:hypothetical protein [Treponema sp.]
MKRILFILALLVVCSCLWAQTVYDTVVTRSRFSYSWAFRYASEFFGVETERSMYDYMGTYITSFHDGDAGWNGFGVVYRAEWKYFMLDLAPSVDVWYTSDGKGTTTADFSVSIQPLLKLPLVDKKFTLSLLAGPEFKIRQEFGMYINGGLDIGFKLTDHHVLFLGGLCGFDLIGPPMYNNAVDRFDEAYGMGYHDWHSSTRIQVTLGIKTLMLEDVFYLNGKEVNRRRR